MKERELVDRIIAYGGFFSDYIKYASPLTDVPRIMHLWVAIGTIAGILGKRVWYQSWLDNKRYPNVYILIIAPSGFYRKSSAISVGRKLVKNVLHENIMPNEFSMEKLIESLTNQPWGIFYIDEHSHLYSQFERSYMHGGKEIFQELFDNIDIERRLKRNVFKITEPSVSIVAGTTSELLLDNTIKLSDLRGGYWGRYLFISAKTKEPSPEDESNVDRVLWASLENHLKEILRATGEIDFNGEADFSLVKTDIKKWIETHEKLTEKNAQLNTFYTRSGEYLKKLSILCQLGIDSNFIFKRVTITPDALQMAILLSEWHRQELTSIFDTELTFTWIDNAKKKVLELIDSSKDGVIDNSVLLQRSHLSSKQLKEVLGTLLESEEIAGAQMESTGTKKKTIWKRKE